MLSAAGAPALLPSAVCEDSQSPGRSGSHSAPGVWNYQHGVPGLDGCQHSSEAGKGWAQWHLRAKTQRLEDDPMFWGSIGPQNISETVSAAWRNGAQ